MRDEVTMHEICAKKIVSKIREKKRKRQQQRVMHIGQIKNNTWSLHRKRIHWEDTILKQIMVQLEGILHNLSRFLNVERNIVVS
jgi:hypothetical protein